MKMPKILVSAGPKKQFYIDALQSLGAEISEEYTDISDFDALILCGGSDIDPKYYNENINGSKDIDQERDEKEFYLTDIFVKAKKPILGICRGHQLLNIYFGGSLYQHIDQSEIHQIQDGDAVHEVTAKEGSILYSLYGEHFCVNSNHHQAIKQFGEGLRLVASAEGIAEAVEHESLPILGVQWHPERMCLTKKRTDTVNGIHIFEYFINLCKK